MNSFQEKYFGPIVLILIDICLLSMIVLRYYNKNTLILIIFLVVLARLLPSRIKKIENSKWSTRWAIVTAFLSLSFLFSLFF